MAKVRSPRCPGCGAALPLRDASPWVRCTYCGREVEIARTAPMSAVPAAERAPVRALAAWLVGLGAVAAIVAAVVLVQRSGRSQRSVAAPAADAAASPSPSPPGSIDARAPGLHAWLGTGNLPVLADVNGDGELDIIGRFSELEPAHAVWLGAFSGRDLAPLWRAGPFADGTGEVRFVGAGEQLVVIDPSPAAHVLDRATGAPRARAELSDRARRLCASPAGDQVFLELVDERDVLLAVATGAVERAARPAWCPALEAPYCRSGLRHAACTPVEPAYRRDDLLRLEHLVRGDDVVLGVGHRHPGSRVPMIAGFAPGGRELRWHRVVPAGDPRAAYESSPELVDLTAGAGFVVYAGAGHAVARLQAFDPRTGAIAWDVAIPDSARAFFTTDWIVATDRRVYLAHDRYTLEVFDRATGASVGGLGLGRP